MYSFRGILQCFSLVLLSTQPIFSKVIRFNDGDITYEYDNSSTPLGKGIFGTVYEGKRTEGNQTESVAFKEFRESNEKLLNESIISSILGQHDSFPTFYRYFPETNETKAVFVMERIGKSVHDLWKEFRPFSNITAMQIRLEILNALEWMHEKGITHNDLHIGNIAVGYHNKSKIYLFDFSVAEMNVNKSNEDLSAVLAYLVQIIGANHFDQVYYYDYYNSLQLDVIASKYQNISDGVLRNETFGKLRSICRQELDKRKNDVDYGKYVDIGYIQDTDDGINLLRKLIKQNDTTAIENLLQSDQQLNINDGFGNSSYYKPIHLAAELGNPRVVQLVIEHGAEINFKYNDTHYAWSPIHYAALNGNADVVRILCERGAEINANLILGITPLVWAIYHGDINVVRLLCERDADINYTDFLGRAPLHHAVIFDRAELVRFLIEHGADFKAVDNQGKTPLDLAIQDGKQDIIKILQEAEQ